MLRADHPNTLSSLASWNMWKNCTATWAHAVQSNAISAFKHALLHLDFLINYDHAIGVGQVGRALALGSR
jgi:hypothetical protein